MLRRLLEHPLAKGLDIDAPEATETRKMILAGKPFLRRLYCHWYGFLLKSIPPGPGKTLELGAGAGFLKEVVPAEHTADILCSDILTITGIDLVLRAEQLPLPDQSLKAILMQNVFHHIPDCQRFFEEATRTVRPGGVIVMIEPWNSWWGRWIYTHLHPEPFDAHAGEWRFPTKGPLSGANVALPWIVLERDRDQFERKNPEWKIESIEPSTPLGYLLSGGMTMRSLVPGGAFRAVRAVDAALTATLDAAMFARIRLRRRGVRAA